MLTRSFALAALFMARLWAVDADFRAGLWEGTLERGRGIEKIALALTISVQYRDGGHPVTAAVARLDSGSGTCGANDAVVEPNRVVFECMTIRATGWAASAGGRFEGYFSPGSNLVTATWRGEPIQLTRPKQSESDGDWVAQNGGQTCVVRFFDSNVPEMRGAGGRATIDIFSSERAVFGKAISGALRPVGRVNFGWTDTDKNGFLGKIGADENELTGLWQGNDFLCGGPDHKVTFRWTRSSL
jgi:hypothetical protein